jgi:peroxiredoxin family protein
MANQKKLAIIATKGTLDWAYPPFILASTAASLDYQVEIFFTFYGLQLLRKKLDLQVSSLGNPAMPMPMPVPVLMQILPGMQAFMTKMMKKTIEKKGVHSVEQLRDICLESDIKMIACQMTVTLFDFNKEDFIDGIEYAGATTFFDFAGDADITLYI